MKITEHDFPPVDFPIWEYTAVGSTAVILLTCSSTKAPCPIRVRIDRNDQTGGAGGEGRASNLSAARLSTSSLLSS